MENRVNLSSSDIRWHARNKLSGNWMIGTAGTFIILYIMAASAAMASVMENRTPVLSVILQIISGLILFPGMAGIFSWNMSVQRGNRPDISEFFSGFKNIRKTLPLGLLIWIVMFAACLPMILVSLIVSANSGTFAFVIPLFIIGEMVLLIWLWLNLSLSFIIQNENPDMSAVECMKASMELMKNNLTKLLCLNLSMIGWSLLAALAYCIVTVVMAVPLNLINDPFYILTHYSSVVAMIIIWIQLNAAFFCFITAPVQVYATGNICVFYRILTGEMRQIHPQYMNSAGWSVPSDIREGSVSEDSGCDGEASVNRGIPFQETADEAAAEESTVQKEDRDKTEM